MKRISIVLALGVFLAPALAGGQDLAASIKAMTAAFSASGSIVLLDSHTILIEPKMPAPVCAVPREQDGKITWAYYAFPLASITVPLELVDDKLIGEDSVFTAPGAAASYKRGEAGDTALIIVAGLPGKQFHTLAYDRDKFLHLSPGPHSASDYGEAPDDTEAFGLTFADRAAAHSFAAALKQAVVLARAQMAQR